MYKVLIVDDEVIEIEYLKSIFQKRSDKYCLVGEAYNGIEAISLSAAILPDIIIMDINMPICSGLIAAKNIKETLKSPIIILNTAYSEFEYAKQAIDYNLDSYLLKPASEDDIFNTIQSCITKNNILRDLPSKEAFLLKTNYPYKVIDNINKSVINRDLIDLRLSIVNYINFMQFEIKDFDQYKLDIVNSIFSILVHLKRVLPDNIFKIFDNENYTYKIMTSNQLSLATELVNDLFNKILCVLDNDQSSKTNVAFMIKKYIDENYNCEISLESLSEKYHYSTSYISRIFHKEHGITINNYINKIRIHNSELLIRNYDLSIKEIALSCGFVNVSHFYRVFKNLSGKTPMQFRNMEDSDYE